MNGWIKSKQMQRKELACGISTMWQLWKSVQYETRYLGVAMNFG